MFDYDFYRKKLEEVRLGTPCSYVNLAKDIGITFITLKKVLDSSGGVNYVTWAKIKQYIDSKEQHGNN